MAPGQKLELLSSGHGLLEGPLYDPQLGLVVSDAENGGVWSFKPGAAPRLLVPHRRGIGGMALHSNGGIVVSGRNVAFKQLDQAKSDEPTVVIVENNPAAGMLGFNDLTTDAAGRIYVGSLAFHAMEVGKQETATGKPAGRLHLVDLDGQVREVADGVVLSNGLGFSPDSSRLYHADSLRHQIEVFRVAEDGSLYDRRIFARVPEALPDGLAVAADGSIWLALCHGGAIVNFASDGTEIKRIAVEVPMVTSLCFGGDDWRDLFIVSGSTGAPSTQGASIYLMRTDVPGMPRPMARIPIRQV
jgi:xylono-1,5-lactonase